MKKQIKTIAIITALAFGPVVMPFTAAAQDNVYEQGTVDMNSPNGYNNNYDNNSGYSANSDQAPSYQTFYDELAPYGQWVNDPAYGNVWVPNAGQGFAPYSTAGHWVYTEYGWTWVSDYAWGWAPFHYGRWNFTDALGWYWIPGNVWGPAWVSWRTAPGYYGWAPLGPAFDISLGCGLGFDYGYYGRGYYGYGFGDRDCYRDGRYFIPESRWNFLDEHHMGDRDGYRYYAPRENNVTIIKNSTIINNTYVDNSTHNTYIIGPRRADVERSTNTRIQPVAIRESSKPVQALDHNALTLYKPATISKATVANRAPAPAHIVSANQIKANIQSSPVNRPAVTQPTAHNAVQPARPQQNTMPKQTVAQNNIPAQHQNSYTAPVTRNAQPIQAGRYNIAPRVNNAPVQNNTRPAAPFTYNAPRQNAPVANNNRPANNYVQPRQTYTAPRQSAPAYNAPRQSYSAPRQSAPAYSAPRQSYSAPRQSYSAPRQSYSAPHQSFSAPRGNSGGGGNRGGSGGSRGGRR